MGPPIWNSPSLEDFPDPPLSTYVHTYIVCYVKSLMNVKVKGRSTKAITQNEEHEVGDTSSKGHFRRILSG